MIPGLAAHARPRAQRCVRSGGRKAGSSSSSNISKRSGRESGRVGVREREIRGPGCVWGGGGSDSGGDIDIYIYMCVHACDSTYQTLEDVVKGEARVLATSVSSDAHAV